MAHDDTDPTREPRPEPVKRAQQAFDAAREYVARTDLGEIRAKATDAASALYKEGREFLANSPEIAQAKDDLRDSIRKNPLAAVGIAFTAGLLLAPLVT